MSNPFFTDYETPFKIPPFESIKVEHYLPAFEKAIRDHESEIEAIADATAPATFDNTVLAVELSGKLLEKVNDVFSNLTHSHTNEALQAVQTEISPKLTAHADSILLNERLFDRIKSIWDAREQLQLPPVAQRLLSETFKNFKRGGALLNETDKVALKEINSEITTLMVQFEQNLLKETNGFELMIDDAKDLEGLPDSVIAGAASTASERGHDGKWIFTPQQSSMYPFLTFSPRRELRERLYKAYIQRGNNGNENDNNEIVARLASLRVRRAKLLGYETHAHYVLEEQMAGSPSAVFELLNQLWPPAIAKAKQESADLQAMIESSGDDFKLEPWDWWFYAERLRKEKYDLDEEAIKPYFSLESALAGMFDVTRRLFGIEMRELNEFPRYHENLRAFEVVDTDGSHLGVFLFDPYTRTSKHGGAWMHTFRDQWNVGGRVRPIVINVCNFPPPTDSAPSLLTFEHVSTMYHEFGHGLHGLLTDVEYESLSGTKVPRDFVEFPSQIMENWAEEPEILRKYARHYETGEPLPEATIERLQAAAKFNQGFANTEYLAASFLDMNWHTLTDDAQRLTAEFETETLNRIGLIPEIASRYRSTYFAHTFSGGYSAGYYSYVWSAVLDTDGFAAFKESGDLFNQELATKYRQHVLTPGNTEDAMELYKKFRGREPKIDALLEKRGLAAVESA